MNHIYRVTTPLKPGWSRAIESKCGACPDDLRDQVLADDLYDQLLDEMDRWSAMFGQTPETDEYAEELHQRKLTAWNSITMAEINHDPT